MSKKLQNHLQDYLSKIKKHSPNLHLSKKWIPKGCKHHPRTLSFAINVTENHVLRGTSSEDNRDDAATLADVDRFLLENFRSLYVEDDDEIQPDDRQVKTSTAAGVSVDSPKFFDLPLGLSGSSRFFVSTRFSSSLIEEARSSGGTNTTMSLSDAMAGSASTSSASINNISNNNGSDNQNECIAVLKYSPSPYDDFRRSMQEMVEARLKHHSEIDWDFMEELVFYHMKLNDKKSHKFILRAFVDLVIDLRQNDMKIPAKPRQCKANSALDLSRSRRTRHNVKL